MAKKQQVECEKCIYKDDLICSHPTNQGVIVKYRVETPVFFKTCIELNQNGKCKNFVELSTQ